MVAFRTSLPESRRCPGSAHEAGECQEGERVRKDEEQLIGKLHAHSLQQELQCLRDCLRGMDPAQRKVLELAYFDGYTQEELAVILNVPLGTVKSRIRRGLARLRALVSRCSSSRPGRLCVRRPKKFGDKTRDPDGLTVCRIWETALCVQS